MVEVRRIEDQLLMLDKADWLKDEFLTWNWWVLVAFLIIPWLIWIVVSRRETIVEDLLVGTNIMLITFILDVVGLQLSLWEYPIKLIPLNPRAWSFDLSMVPVAFMLLYQYFTTWKSYIAALLLMAAMYAFIGEPFSEWVQFVHYIKWNYFYSFFYYIAAGISVRMIVLKLVAVSKRGTSAKKTSLHRGEENA
ncbi:hypothetical protein CVD19_10580 [Bacillus sp. T33-2]|nr:hypothetical protein CVD19_10580 [Bacillus sp. T33-2]